jgi:hypothetical protein
MIQQNASCDPHIHQLAVRLARKCVGIIEPLLRQEVIPEACREFYLVIREGLEDVQQRKSA